MVSSADVVAAVLAAQVLHVLVQAARPFEWEQTPGFPLIQPAIAPLSDNKFLVAGGINGDRLRVLSAYVCKGVNASPSNCTEIAKLPFDIEVMGAAPLGNQSVLVSGITETGPGGVRRESGDMETSRRQFRVLSTLCVLCCILSWSWQGSSCWRSG